MSLFLYVIDENLNHMFASHIQARRPTDSGVDLLCPAMTLDFSQSKLAAEIRTGVVAAAVDNQGRPMPYLLLARSSTSLTPLRMSNQVGLADSGYRGELFARVDCVDPAVNSFEIPAGRRLFQIVQHNWLPFENVILVNTLSQLPSAQDNRGAGGLGSSGN
jgi:dUTPase